MIVILLCPLSLSLHPHHSVLTSFASSFGSSPAPRGKCCASTRPRSSTALTTASRGAAARRCPTIRSRTRSQYGVAHSRVDPLVADDRQLVVLEREVDEHAVALAASGACRAGETAPAPGRAARRPRAARRRSRCTRTSAVVVASARRTAPAIASRSSFAEDVPRPRRGCAITSLRSRRRRRSCRRRRENPPNAATAPAAATAAAAERREEDHRRDAPAATPAGRVAARVTRASSPPRASA